MFRDMRPRSRALIAATTLGLIAAPLTFAQTATANPAGDGLVITEAYLNGGSAGATYSHKFVEIYNPTSDPINLTGRSVQYRSATGTGTASTAVALTGTVAAHDYYVLRGGFNGTEGANGIAVPNVDQVSSLQPSGSAGSIFLADGTSAINPVASAASVVDLLGYGTTNASEGAATTAASLTTSLQRQKVADVENKDTDVNSADFSSLAPTPGSGYVAPPAPDEFEGTIAEIQGTGTASPHEGDIATTRGVVTAAYPTGGFSGFYIQ
ncbi:MAG: lamin tail domain-containing protein, partial [Nocardioides sp.]